MKVNIENSIAKYLSDEMNDYEKNRFEKWIKANKKNQELFDYYYSDWKTLEHYNKMKSVNTDKAWENLKQRLENDQLIPKENDKKKNINLWYKVAAMIIAFIALSWITFTWVSGNFGNQVKLAAAENQIVKTRLQDGSVVILKHGSEIAYPKSFSEKQRVVTMKGQAFFEVSPDQTKPFIVKTTNAGIRVVGTAFNVTENPIDHSAEVYVESGKVFLYDPDNPEVKKMLTPGKIGILKDNTIRVTENNNPNYLAWKTKVFVFDGEKLENVFRELERAYAIHIDYEDDIIGQFKLSTKFDNQSVDTIIKIICTTFNLESNKKQSDYVISLKEVS